MKNKCLAVLICVFGFATLTQAQEVSIELNAPELNDSNAPQIEDSNVAGSVAVIISVDIENFKFSTVQAALVKKGLEIKDSFASTGIITGLIASNKLKALKRVPGAKVEISKDNTI